MTRLNLSLKEYNRLTGKAGKEKRADKPVTLPPVQVQWDAWKLQGGIWIQIPDPPPSLNEWMNWHWAKRGKYKDELTDDIHKLVLFFKFTRYKLATVQVIHYFKTKRKRDPSDNYAPKFLMDALVRSGVLEDDNGEMVTVLIPELKVDRNRPRTEVFIWEGLNAQQNPNSPTINQS